MDKYGRGSAAANGEGFVDLAPGDTFAALEAQLKRRIAERFDNLALGISASIGSKRNASELAKHLASGEEEEAHKFAAKNVGILFAKGGVGVVHFDKKAVDETREKPKIFRVFSPFVFAGEPLVATITIKPADDGLRLYAIEALDIMRGERLEVHLAAKPRQFKTTRPLLTDRIAYYVGDVNRTHPNFVGGCTEPFTVIRTVELLESLMSSAISHQPRTTKHQSPTFSIIIPAYNVAHYLHECLDSVLAQDFENWECVVVDDESTDEGPRILDEYAAKDRRFRVIHQKNKGEGGARNSGIVAAKGEWIFFLDGDDVMAPNALTRLAALIEKYPNENLFRFGFANFEDGAALPKIGHCRADDGPVDLSHEIAYKDFFVYVWQFLYRRSLIEGMMFDRYRRGADRTFIVPVLCKAKSFVATEDVGYLYRKRAGSAMNSRPSVQVLKDELSHRVDVIAAIDASGKKMSYRKTDWLELYCTRGYQRLVRDYSVDERRVLMSWFYHELPRIRSAKDFSWRARFDCFLYIFCRGRFGWWFVSWLLPITMHRAKVALTDFPYVMRAIRRRLI